ncbi:MAG: hypothetical protein V4537_14530 [Pseudomonadota bacterium]
MPIVENHAEHPFHFPKPIRAIGAGGKEAGPLDASTSAYEEAINFPRAGNPDDEGNPTPSKTEITEEQLDAIRKHPVARGWFHRRGLAVSADANAVASTPVGSENALGAPAARRPKP